MGFKRIITSSILLMLIFSGCAPTYVPTTVNSPLLTYRGEFQAAIYAGSSGFDPQLAYAITDHIAVMLNGSFKNSQSDSSENFHKHQFVELGVGYYLRFVGKGRFEVFGGYGLGNLQAHSTNSIFNSDSDVKLNRIFIQPGVGMVTDLLDLSFATRFVIVGVDQDPLKYTRSFLEPAATCRIGYKLFKFSAQIGYSIPFNSSNLVDYQPFMFSLGIHTRLH
jgi:hypothetical protein